MSDIIEDLLYSYVPQEDRERWTQNVMDRAAKEIIQLREENKALREAVSNYAEEKVQKEFNGYMGN